MGSGHGEEFGYIDEQNSEVFIEETRSLLGNLILHVHRQGRLEGGREKKPMVEMSRILVPPQESM